MAYELAQATAGQLIATLPVDDGGTLMLATAAGICATETVLLNAGDSIPARGKGRDFTQDERDKINEIGGTTGCHTCGTMDPGTKPGNFVPDHQPPSATAQDGDTQRLYPQCLSCSKKQGGEVRSWQRKNPPPPPPPPPTEPLP